jgi:ferredoxin
MTVLIEIDRDACIQCGRCYNEECGEIYMEGEDGTSEIKEQFRDGGDVSKGKVPDDMLECANKSVEVCPVDAIKVTPS